MKHLYSIIFLIFASSLTAQIVNIPDPVFKAFLLNHTPVIDLNGNDQIEVSEALLVTTLAIPPGEIDNPIENLTGLEAFTNLTWLSCAGSNQYGAFNLAPLVNLQYLDCSGAYYAIFHGVESLTNLQHLECQHSNVPGIADITALTNLEYLDCSWGVLNGTLNASNLPNLNYLDCSRLQLTSLNLSGTINLNTLYCVNSNLTTLNLSSQTNLIDLNSYFNPNLVFTPPLGNLTSLKHLNCRSNGLTTLNLTGLVNLITLNCSENNISILNFTNLQDLTELYCAGNNFLELNLAPLTSLTHLMCGVNPLSALNVNMLSELRTLDCNQTQINAIDMSQLANVESLDLSYNPQLTTIDLAGLTSLKTLECAENALTTLSLEGAPVLETLSCYNNQLTDLDTSNNPLLRSVVCYGNLFTTLDFSFYSGNQSAGYAFHTNPLLEYVNLKNGRPVTVNFNTLSGSLLCPILAYICADEENIEAINFEIWWEGSNDDNVQVNSFCTFTPGGTYNTISGTLGIDTNVNGCGINDLYMQGIKVDISNGTSTSSTFTDSQGNYTFYVQSGAFAITPVVENPYFTVSPSSATVTFTEDGGSSQSQNFCFTPIGIRNDLEITIAPINAARPGFDAEYNLILKNKGNQNLSGTVSLSFDDSILNFISATPMTDNQLANALSWNYTNLQPLESRLINLTLNVNAPTEIPAVNNGDVLNYTASIDPIANDETPADNVFTLEQIVVGSFDPNDKTCLEGNNISPQMIGDYLHYLIRFQNSGTAPAENIVVRDMIDITKFDISSLQLTASSHQNVTRITDNKVEFIFEGINLPAEQDNEPGSHGYVTFKIKTLNNLTLGNTVSNTADIFFDYNFPIVTNTTMTTISNLGIDQFENVAVNVSPIPVKNLLNINSKDQITSIELFDAQGRLIEINLVNSLDFTFDMSRRSSGIYFLKTYTANGKSTKKVIKE